MSIPPDLLTSLRDALSSDRIDAYRKTPSDTDLDLLERYFWNMALSEALYPSLHALEVALRNNIYEAITHLYGSSNWLTQQPSILSTWEQDKVTAVLQKLRGGSGMPVPAGKIVAELTFGFWTSLLDKRYQRVLWPQLLYDTFPNMPRRIRTRHTASVRMSDLRRLRNRVFHHEPIWHWHDLPQQHLALLEAIGWLDTAMSNTISLFDRFPAVHGQGGSSYRIELEHLQQNWS